MSTNFINQDRGAFFNYVDKILVFFGHLPHYVASLTFYDFLAYTYELTKSLANVIKEFPLNSQYFQKWTKGQPHENFWKLVILPKLLIGSKLSLG